MAFTLSTVTEILKTDFKPRVRAQLNNATVLHGFVKKDPEAYQGSEAKLALHNSRNVGTGARREGAKLPVAGNQGYANAKFGVAYLYGGISLTGPSMKATRNDVGAYVRGLHSEMVGLTKDLKVDMNRQLWHDGTGVLTHTLANSAGATNDVEVESTKFIKVGMQIMIVDKDAVVKAVGRTVTVVIDDNNFTIDGGTITWAVGQLVIGGVNGTDADGARDIGSATLFRDKLEMWGLEAICSDVNPGRLRSATLGTAVGLGGFDQGIVSGQFGQIDRNANSFWRSNFLTTQPRGTAAVSPRDLEMDLMQHAYDLSDIEADEEPGLILGNHALKRRYAALLQADKRYPSGGEITLDGGYKALEFNGTALTADKDASLTATPQKLERFYFLVPSTLKFLIMADWQWMDEDGAMLSRVSNKDQYEATMFSYQDFACDRPNANTVLDNVKETA